MLFFHFNCGAHNSILHACACITRRLWHYYPHPAVLPGGKQQLPVACAADVKIAPDGFAVHGFFDQVFQRNFRPKQRIKKIGNNASKTAPAT